MMTVSTSAVHESGWGKGQGWMALTESKAVHRPGEHHSDREQDVEYCLDSAI